MREWLEDLKYRIVDPFFKWMGYAPIMPEPDTMGMIRYDEVSPVFVNITKIVVPTYFDRDQIMLAAKYLHDNRTIDTDLMAVNTLVHIYQNPDLFLVE